MFAGCLGAQLTQGDVMSQPIQVSQKKYGTAVCLSGIFGMLGIHHFYLGRHLHGLADFGMFVTAFALYVIGNFGMAAGDAGSGSYLTAALIIFAIDAVHTIWVTILLLTGQYRDGKGLLITYPGQRIKAA